MRVRVGLRIYHLKERELKELIAQRFKKKARIIGFKKLGEGFHNAGFLLTFKVDGREHHWVMRVARGDTGWGHDYPGDRAATLLLQHQLFNSAPKDSCCRSIDVVALLGNGKMVSIGDATEFLGLVEEVKDTEWQPYSEDLFRIAHNRTISDQDLKRCDILVDYLARLHSRRKKNPILYMRHIRDLIGHGEMLMGVVDTYPDLRRLDFTTPKEIEEIEMKVVGWRNKIKFKDHRLSRIHGDFHPFGNIRFRSDDSVMALDLAREEYGEPADDVSSLSMNYVFFSIWHYGQFLDPFKGLFNRFMNGYLKATGDKELLSIIPPFYAFRGLVVAHPHYYPDMERAKRRSILNFIVNVLDDDRFEIDKVEEYLEA